MGTYKELVSRVMLRLDLDDGRARLATEESINAALKYMARVKDFDELMTLDTTNALTEIDIKLYHLVDDWGLTRPKDLYTLRYMDESSSRKLIYVPVRRLDEIIPYTEQLGTRRPKWYTRRGDEIELVPIPDAAKSIYVFYSQWPATLSADDDEPPYSDLDDVITTLATDIASGILSGSFGDYIQRARELLGVAIREEISRPDRAFAAQPFQAEEPVYGEYWSDPFVKRDPS